MKVKIISGSHLYDYHGKTFEAVINPQGTQAYFFDHAGVGIFLSSSDFEVVTEEPARPRVSSLVDLIGGVPSKIQVEF